MSTHRHTVAPPELSHGSAQPESSSAQDASSSLSAAPSIDERPVATPDQAQSVATALGPPQPEDGPEDPRTALMYMVLDQLKVIKSRLDSVEQGEHSPPSAQDPQQPPPPTPLPPVDPPSPSAASKGKTRVVPEEVKTRNATAVSTIPHVTGIPPHLEMMEDPDPIEAFACMPQGEKDSFRFMLRRFGINPTVLIGMLQGKSASASGTSGSQPTSLTKSSTVDPPPRSSTPLADRARALPAPKVVTDTPSTTVSTVDSSGRVPHCRPEYLGSFNGQAEELEVFIRTVNSVARSNPDPAWQMAVVRALPLVMEDEASAWLIGLHDEEAKTMTTLQVWFDVMRESFPVNEFEQRRQARSRQWNTETEGASAYYFTKLRLLRAAYGNDQSEANLAVDILDGLPATFRVMLRIPRRNPTLKDIRQEISARAPDWKELYATSQTRTSLPPRPAPPTAHLPAKPSSNPSSQGHRSTPSGSGGGTPSAAAGSSNPSSGTPYVPVTPETYDPRCVIPATNGGKRVYRRPDNGRVMTPNRPCGICGGDHFNFEHPHITAQVRIAEAAEEYPEEDPVEEDFGTSAMTEN